jgi:hypothetical protein
MWVVPDWALETGRDRFWNTQTGDYLISTADGWRLYRVVETGSDTTARRLVRKVAERGDSAALLSFMRGGEAP